MIALLLLAWYCIGLVVWCVVLRLRGIPSDADVAMLLIISFWPLIVAGAILARPARALVDLTIRISGAAR
jgi:hypothetical protein